MIPSISQIRAVTPLFDQIEFEAFKPKFSFVQKWTRYESFRIFRHWAIQPIDTHFGRLHIQSQNGRLLISGGIALAMGLLLYLW